MEQCPICGNHIAFPAVLPCAHTFCEQCLHNDFLAYWHRISQSAMKKDDSDKPKESDQTPDGNVSAFDDDTNVKYGKYPYECGVCREKIVVDCTERGFVYPTLARKRENLFCPKHSSRVLEAFCECCMKPFCFMCIHTEKCTDFQHKIHTPGDAIPLVSERLLKMEANIGSRLATLDQSAENIKTIAKNNEELLTKESEAAIGPVKELHAALGVLIDRMRDLPASKLCDDKTRSLDERCKVLEADRTSHAEVSKSVSEMLELCKKIKESSNLCQLSVIETSDQLRLFGGMAAVLEAYKKLPVPTLPVEADLGKMNVMELEATSIRNNIVSELEAVFTQWANTNRDTVGRMCSKTLMSVLNRGPDAIGEDLTSSVNDLLKRRYDTMTTDQRGKLIRVVEMYSNNPTPDNYLACKGMIQQSCDK